MAERAKRMAQKFEQARRAAHAVEARVRKCAGQAARYRHRPRVGAAQRRAAPCKSDGGGGGGISLQCA
jgi:hypothetical protein